MSFLEDKTPLLEELLRNKEVNKNDYEQLSELYRLYRSYFEVNATADHPDTIKTLHDKTMETMNNLAPKGVAYPFIKEKIFSDVNALWMSQMLNTHNQKV